MVDILLATYNGEAYLKEMLDSLLGQTMPVSYTHLDVYKRQRSRE